MSYGCEPSSNRGGFHFRPPRIVVTRVLEDFGAPFSCLPQRLQSQPCTTTTSRTFGCAAASCEHVGNSHFQCAMPCSTSSPCQNSAKAPPSKNVFDINGSKTFDIIFQQRFYRNAADQICLDRLPALLPEQKWRVGGDERPSRSASTTQRPRQLAALPVAPASNDKRLNCMFIEFANTRTNMCQATIFDTTSQGKTTVVK